MEPATPDSDRTTWKLWGGTLTTLAFLVLGVPAIASLPHPIAYTIAVLLAIATVGVTRALARTQRSRP